MLGCVAFFYDEAGESDDRLIQQLERRVYDLAFFWHLDPVVIMRKPLGEFFEMESHAVRIAEVRNRG